MEEALQSLLEVAKGELTHALVNGTGDFSEDNLLRGRILGLEASRQIIHSYFEELSRDSGDIDEKDE